jgi:4-hydroxy-3-methylbut-2-en-1-yl diphosphate reductase
MARLFEIPSYYRSSVISAIKNELRAPAGGRKDLTPFVLDLEKVCFKIARHFGFCFGVENAIEIAYRALRENPGKRVFLLSEMIHNRAVNADLQSKGVQFLRSAEGRELLPFSALRAADIVIIPAFGTTLELFEKLSELGVETRGYNATCPFVEKVWRRAAQLGERGYTIVIHGKHSHEETQATFSHASRYGPSLVVRDLDEAKMLASFISRETPVGRFAQHFQGRVSAGFEAQQHLRRIGVVNQTTMLAPETLAISGLLHQAMLSTYGEERISEHFADTKDTLCYATNENQEAISGLIDAGGDLALVVGGYNSSNTLHLVELCQKHVPTFFIQDASEILDQEQIRHFKTGSRILEVSRAWLPQGHPPVILLTAGASCPDSLVDEVINKIAGLYGVAQLVDNACQSALRKYRSAD